jgi:hypothetical protein
VQAGQATAPDLGNALFAGPERGGARAAIHAPIATATLDDMHAHARHSVTF